MKRFLKKNWFALLTLIVAAFLALWISISYFFLDEDVYYQQLIYIASFSMPLILLFFACLDILIHSEELSEEQKKELEMKKNILEFLKNYNATVKNKSSKETKKKGEDN